MITTDKARQLLTQHSLDDAIAIANQKHQDTGLGYWRNVARVLQVKKDKPHYNL